MRGHYFYSQIDQQIFVSTNARFVEKNYMMSKRAKCDIDWKALENAPTFAQEAMGPKVSTPTIPINSSTLVPRHSGRVVIQPNRFMYLGESFEAIQKEHEIDLIDCDEVMSSNDVILWQQAMEANFESMYFNRIWDLVEASEGIKPIGCKWVYKREKKWWMERLRHIWLGR